MNKIRILKSIGILILSSFLIKIFGFFREILIAYYYGTSKPVDDFNIFMIYPNFMLNTFAPAIGIALVSKIILDKSSIELKEIRVNRYIISLIFFVLLTSLLNSILVYIYSGNEYTILNYVLVFMLPILYFIQVVMVYYNQAYENFKIGAFTSLLQVIVSALVILVSVYYKSISILLISVAIGLLVQIVVLIIYFIKENRSIKLFFSYEKNNSYNEIMSILTSMLGLGLIEILISLTKFMASFLSIEGFISSINYSYKVMNLPISIIMISIISVLFPEFNKFEKKGNRDKIYSYSLDITKYITVIMVPFSVFLFISSNYVIRLLFNRGNFDAESLLLTSSFFKYLVFLIPLLSLIMLLFRIQYVYVQYKQIILNGIFSILVLILVQYYGVFIHNMYVFNVSLVLSLLTLLFLQIKNLKYSLSVFINVKCFISTILAGIIISYLFKTVDFYNDYILLCMNFILYFLIYLVLQILLRDKTVKELLYKTGRKLVK